MKNIFKSLLCATLLLSMVTLTAQAQFEEPEIEKVGFERTSWFMNKFEDIKWTGAGFYDDVKLSDRQTNEIRARLQKVYGDPTKTIDDLIKREDFRTKEAIQFEYWFIIDGHIPMMVLDIDGPFGRGLVYAGASKYIDLMPQIKRVFSEQLMGLEENELAEYQDYYYSTDRSQWYQVSYKDGTYSTKKISSPQGMSIH